ncbi:MAG: hypothetical protein AAGL49_04975, partial [Pseudomonadota bacterium]
LDGNLGELEQAAKVTSTLESMDGDSEIEHVLGGQKKLAKITGGKLGKSREVQSAIKKAEQLAKKYDGTIVETQARDFVKRMRAANNPWGEGATTLEWTLTSPPPFHQFNELPRIK